jgi:flagellar hook-associated protein 3 FlgL
VQWKNRETLIKAFPAPNLRCEAAKPLQIRAHPPEVLRKMYNNGGMTMRVTNNMILKNSAYNINSVKTAVDESATQMTTQKKISRPSQDPVTAIRSLRLSTSLSKVNQYYKRNIPDANSWLEVTETALTSMKDLIGNDFRSQVVAGATDVLTQDDRNTIITQLKQLQSQLYAEGNADYAGRTVFTGFRTNQNLVFDENEPDTSYNIDQTFSYTEMETFRYYTGNVVVPTTQNEVMNNDISDTQVSSYYRLRTAYNDVTEMNSLSYTYGGNTVTFDMTGITNGTTQSPQTGTASLNNLTVYDTEDDWLAACTSGIKEVGDTSMVFIKDTGDLILGSTVAAELQSNKASISVNYDKTGFSNGELKPEYYFNCTDTTDPQNKIVYEKYDADGNEITYDINYTVANNQTLTVNLEAKEAFNSDILRDMDDMIAAVSRAIDAHDKVDTIKAMKEEAQYSDQTFQDKLSEWQEAAQKEADYADDNLQKLFNTELGKSDEYLDQISLALTKVGCTVDQLQLTETRMSNQQETIQDLQSQNDDEELSDVIINYTAVYNAYQSSLSAAAKLNGMTLLNYL